MDHEQRLRSDVDRWNIWRRENPKIKPDLSNADLSGLNLWNADMSSTNLVSSNLSKAHLQDADLSNADLSEADLTGANLTHANLSKACAEWATFIDSNMRGCNLSDARLAYARFNSADLFRACFARADLTRASLAGTNLGEADFSNACLIEADLSRSVLVLTCLADTELRDNRVFGVSVWSIEGEPRVQEGLLISRVGEPTITVDNLELAQFIYLLLNNQKLRRVIDTITSKVVLILGRFTAERKAVLDALKDAVRKRGYSPVLFDFEAPASRNLTETVRLLAHMSRFVVADITDAKSIPQELMAIVPSLPSVPVQPIILESEAEYGMFNDFRAYPWVLNIYRYETIDSLLSEVETHVIAPAEQALAELAAGRL